VAPIVVVGAGVAGATAAATLRDLGFDGEVVLIGEEPLAAYERPPLSKEYLRGESDLLWVRPDGWYAEHGIDARFGARAERVDVTGRAIELAGGERIAFDQAVIATGARNRRFDWPGLDLPGVHDLRFAPDADEIREQASTASKAVLVGMGFIGSEVAASLRDLGLDVTVVEFTATPLERVLGPQLGAAIEALHRDHGVEMVFGDAAERFEGDGRFEALVTRGGRRIEGDLAVVGVGVEPVTDAWEAGGGAVENGITVDATLRSAVDGVWAIGDVARHDHPVFGPIRLEHFDNALKMGEHVAGNLLGKARPFDDAHWFWSDQYDARIEMAGFAREWDATVIRGSIEERSFAAFLLKDGRLLSTFTMNRRFDARRSMPLIAQGARPHPAQLADPGFDLRSLRRPASRRGGPAAGG
jgi:3-phenylpropionate/trans-cinnamate dioxygenase ferredoxin reductase subunit